MASPTDDTDDFTHHIAIELSRALNLVNPNDASAVARLPEIDGDDSDYEMEEGWDAIGY